jgi:hypothetical protein
VRTPAPARKNESTDQKVLSEKDSILLYGHHVSRIESLRSAFPENAPPSPLAPVLLAAADLDSISQPPHHCDSVVVHYIRQSLPQKMQFVESLVIIYAYHHVWLLPPEPPVVKHPKFTRLEGADTVM